MQIMIYEISNLNYTRKYLECRLLKGHLLKAPFKPEEDDITKSL